MSGTVAQDADPPAWEFFRGPNYDGHSSETGIANSWPEQGPPVLWTRELGQGYSSFTGRGRRIFTQYQTLTGQYVICLDAATGETVWEHRYDWSYEAAGLYPGPRSTPTLDGDYVYFTSPRGTLGCLRQSDGTPVWEVDMIKSFQANPVDFGYACSPVVVDEKVILPVGGAGASVVAFDKQDGSVIWQTGAHEISYASILPIEHAGRKIVVAYLKNTLELLDLETGDRLCELLLSNGYDEHSAWPIYSDSKLWISAPFREGSRLLQLTADDPPQLKRIWATDILSNDVCSSVLVGDSLYGFDIHDVQSKIHRPSRGSFRSIDFDSGRSNWENGSADERRTLDSDRGTAAADSVGHSSVIFADDKLILLNDVGELILIEASPGRFQQLARIQILGGEICWTLPMLLDRRLYLRNQSRAVCLYLGDPAELPATIENALTVADVPQTANFDLATLVFSVEPEYAMDAPTPRWLVNWFWVMLVAGWFVAYPLAAITVRIAGRIRRLNHVSQKRRTLFRVLAIAIGIVGTTLISSWFNDFVFTWPLVLAIVFEILVYQTKISRRSKTAIGVDADGETEADGVTDAARKTSAWPGRIAAVLFFATCCAYFFLCRRLSLAFEWSFLVGFPAAVPFQLWGRWISTRPGYVSALGEWLCSALAFAAFYWAGAALILWKY